MTDETQGASPIEDAPVLPVETPVEDSSTSPPEPEAPVENKADDAEPQPRDEEGKFLSKNAQKRIDELTWRAAEREREAAYWRDLALQQQQKPEPPKVEAPARLPTLEEHGYDEAKYQAALIEYATKQAERVVEDRLTKAEQQRAEQQRLEAFAQRQREFAAKAPDFESKVLRDPTLPISQTMRDVIVDSPTGPEIAYYLANNRELAEQIARLPGHLAALEMGRIEGRLTAEKAAQTRPKPQVTQAPPPPPKVETTDTSLAGIRASDPESDSLSVREWMERRNKELRKKR